MTEKLSQFEVDQGTVDQVTFIETTQVKEGVECDVYEFSGDKTKDLGIVRVRMGETTPPQLVLDGVKTLEGYVSGQGSLIVERSDHQQEVYRFDNKNHTSVVNVDIGDVMQWRADGDQDLSFYEICYPPYKDGRFENLREINRKIAALVIISSDGKILMGRKDPASGGVYPDAWHIPGGGMEEGETLEDTAIREGTQEVVGLELKKGMLRELPFKGSGSALKTIENDERVWCNMEFNHFEVRLDTTAEQLAQTLHPGDDLVELRWFSKDELEAVRQVPGGKEFFRQAGYLDPES